MSQFSDQILLSAAENGEFENVRNILTNPDFGTKLLSLSQQDKENNLLVLASKSGNLSLVKLLIEEHSFDKESVGTVLFSEEEDPIVEAPVLWTAATAGHLPVVKYLLSVGCDVDKATKTNSTPIRGACYDGHLEVVEYLVGCGGNFNTPNENGQTPLLVACGMDHFYVVEYLIKIRADLDTQAVKGLTALHIACERDYRDIAVILMHAGASLLNDEQGATALMLAAVNGNEKSLSALLTAFPNCVSCEARADLYTVLGCSKYDKAIQGRGTSCLSTAIKYWFKAAEVRDKLPRKTLSMLALNRADVPEVYGNDFPEPLTTAEMLEILPDDSKVGIYTLLARERILGPSHYLIYFLRLRAAIDLDRQLYQRSLLLLDRSILLSYTALRPDSNPLRYIEQSVFILQCQGMAYRDQKRELTTVFFEWLTSQIEMFYKNFSTISKQESWQNRCDEDLITVWLHELVLLLYANGPDCKTWLRKMIDRIASLGYSSKKSGSSVLHIACCLDTNKSDINSGLVGQLWPNTDCLRLLCSHFDVDARDQLGRTPLLATIQSTADHDLRHQTVELLLENGAHPDTLCYSGLYAADCEYESANSFHEWGVKNLIWKYTSLKCRAARILCRQVPGYQDMIPPSLVYFLSLHS